MICIMSHQWCMFGDDSIGNIHSKHISPSGCGRPSTWLCMQQWHKSQMKTGIIVGCNKMDQYTFMYVDVSSEVFQSIGQVVLLTIFFMLYEVPRSIVFDLHISRVIWSPLRMISSGYLNVVLQFCISFGNCNLDHLLSTSNLIHCFQKTYDILTLSTWNTA